ncbi:MAG: DUF2461 domain-containing protein [Candidatus Sumerlaeia bacterium]
MSRYISQDLFRFFRELRRHNEREWFERHKARYEAQVREPLLGFISDFAPHLHAISPHFTAIAKKTGGSLFRPQRDTRFSSDKRPYKENAGLQFRHARGRDAHAPCFYLHLAPGEVFAAAGVWRPQARTADLIRAAILDDPAGWSDVVNDRRFRRAWGRVQGERLRRPPGGAPADHPFLDDLCLKEFLVWTQFTEDAACRADFLGRFARLCAAAGPFMRFLCRALDLPF